MKNKFKLNDKVQSSKSGGDLRMGIGSWEAKVVEIMPIGNTEITDTHDGMCYVTVGRWSSKPKAKLTSRQLWSEHLDPR